MLKFSKLVICALGCVVSLTTLLLAQPAPTEAFPQLPVTTDEAGPNTGNLERLVVTGYVVPRIGTGPAPVVTLDQDFIEKQSDQTVADVLLRLPQNVGSFTPAVNAGTGFSPGASAVNLRGLGVNSTLVLIDGHRQVPYPFPQGGIESFVDLNSIPLAAVDRIEVLKDGASAIYGSDAIAGVVNIILKDQYDGADITSYFGTSQRGDATTYRTSLVGGISKLLGNDSKFSIVATFDYFEQDPIQSADRSYSFILDHNKFGSFNSQESSFAPAGNFTDVSGNSYAVIPGTKGPTITAGDFSINGLNTYNPTPFDQLLPREQRYGGYLKVNYQPFQWLKVYEEFLANHLEETNQAAPTTVASTDGITIPATNPNNPFGIPLTPTGWRVLEYGPTQGSVTVDTYRTLTGISFVNLPRNWFVDASFLYAESDGDNRIRNAVSRSGLNAALSGSLEGFAGVFYNPFTDTSTGVRLNRPLVDATRITIDNNSRTGLTMWAIKAGGEVLDLPGGPVTVGVGGEYRSDEFVQVGDKNSTNFNVVGFGGGNGGGKDYIWSGYGELTIPILGEKLSAPGARSLQVILAERYDNYSTFGDDWKPKISILYRPLDDLTLRASYAEGFRAPALTELFAGELIGFTNPIVDPVTGTVGSFQVRTFGNPNLQAESSYSYYVGAVWAPGSADPDHSWWGWANGFTAYVDWTEITKRNEIAQLSSQFILANEAEFPGAVVRLQNGIIDHINDPFLNLASVRVDSVDFGAAYTSKEYPWGKINAEIDATYFYHVMQQNQPGTPLENITDTFGTPDFKMTASIFYSKTLFGIDTVSTGFTLNYIDSEHDQADTFQGALASSNAEPNGLVHRIGSFTTVDWQISYQLGKAEQITPETPRPGYGKDGKRVFGESTISPKLDASSAGWRRWLANTKIVFGINNIGDVRPPFADVFEGYDTASSNAFGRYYYVELEKKF